MKRFIAICCFLLLIIHTSGQTNYHISGVVTDAAQNKLSDVTIRIQGTSIGTITNKEGAFRLLVPDNYLGKNIVFSHLGYKSVLQSIPTCFEEIIKIRLTPEVYELSEIAIKPKNAKDIIAEAVAKIPENYPDTTHFLEYFYRESIKENQTFVALNDAICLLKNEGYSRQLDIGIEINNMVVRFCT